MLVAIHDPLLPSWLGFSVVPDFSGGDGPKSSDRWNVSRSMEANTWWGRSLDAAVLGLDWLGLQIPKCAFANMVSALDGRWYTKRPGIFSVCFWDTITVTSSSSITTLKMEWSYRMWHRFRGAACHCAIVTVAPEQINGDEYLVRTHKLSGEKMFEKKLDCTKSN